MKPTALQIENTQLRAKNSTLLLALSLTQGSPDATERFHYDGSVYTYRLYGAVRADGGIVTVTFHHRGQHDSINAHLFDAHDQVVRNLPFTEQTTHEKIAMDRLRTKRAALVEPFVAKVGGAS